MRVLRVNMIPASRSGETNQDSEPFLAVNPTNPNLIIGTAFTHPPDGGPNAPIFVSRDGGRTWILWSIVPGVGGELPTPTGDISVAFDGAGTDLYIAAIREDSVRRSEFLGTTIVLRTNVAAMTAPTTAFSQDTSTPRVIDQPLVSATTVTSGMDMGNHRVYVACNDINSFPGPTAKILFSTDAAIPTPSFRFVSLDTRPAIQDAAQVRAAHHQDGTVYAAFLGLRSRIEELIATDVVVTRDDHWGRGNTTTPAFTALLDSGDGLAGQRVVVNASISSDLIIGQERVDFRLGIAVDPRNSRTVYLAWGDIQSGTYTLHLRRSDDGGQTWGSSDLLNIPNATNPGLAVNTLGEVAFMYQQLTVSGGEERWETRMRLRLGRRIWDGLGFVSERDLLLASTPARIPEQSFLPYIGDYLGLVSVGRNFYGVFSACNIPDRANFPPYNEHTDLGPGGPHFVNYQRNADFTRHVLLNVDGRQTVAPSIDPFFVSISFDDEFRRISVGLIVVDHSGCGDAPIADTSVSFSIRVGVEQPWWRESELISVTYEWSVTGGTQESPTNMNSTFQVRMPLAGDDGIVAPVVVSLRVHIRIGDAAPQTFERGVTIRPITPEQSQFSCLIYTITASITAAIYGFLLLVLPPFQGGPFPDPPPLLKQQIPGNFMSMVLNVYRRVTNAVRPRF